VGLSAFPFFSPTVQSVQIIFIKLFLLFSGVFIGSPKVNSKHLSRQMALPLTPSLTIAAALSQNIENGFRTHSFCPHAPLAVPVSDRPGKAQDPQSKAL